MRARFFRLGLCLLLTLPLIIQAADFQQGVDAYTRGDYALALQTFESLAKQGHTDAQNNLGVIYQTGRGVDQDAQQAAEWYRQAAEKGHADAQNNLASLYVTGNGVEQDYLKAYAWFNQAAAQGDEGAEQNRDYVASRLNPEQVSRAQQLSLLAAPYDGHSALPAPRAATPSAATATAADTAVATASSPSSNTNPSAGGASVAAPAGGASVAAPAGGASVAAPAGGASVAAITDPTARRSLDAVPNSSSPSSPRFYAVDRGDTLWSIAERLKPQPSVSTWNMVLALQQLNPNAFSGGGASSLRLGAQLRIPDMDDIPAISKDQARAEVERRSGNR